MKKIFGVLSLIAILTVAFTSQASANSPDTQVVYDIGSDSYEFVAVSVGLVVEVGLFYVADETVKDSSVEGLSENGNSVNDNDTLSAFDGEFYKRGKEPIRYANSIITFDGEFYKRGKEPIRYANETIKENSCSVKSVTEIYSDAERPVGWC